MSSNIIQPSFAAGELSPTLYARVDLAKYHVGAALLENFFVDYRGGATNRTGTAFVGQARRSDSKVRLIPFQFSTIQTYILEFSDLAIRVIKDGGFVVNTGVPILSITKAAEGVVTTTIPHGFSSGDLVFLSDILGMTELNQVTAIVDNATLDTFGLFDEDGEPIDTRSFGTYTSGGFAAKFVTIVTPYLAADIPMLKFTQSADVMTLTHPDYAPANLTRTSDTSWTLTNITFATTMTAPGAPTVTASAAGVAVFSYVITAVGDDGQESIASAVGGVSAAVNIAATAGHIDLSWTAVTGADFYNIYKANPLPTAGTIPTGVSYGFVGSVTGIGWTDNNITPDFAITPPNSNNPFSGGNNPGAVAYFQQRLVFASSTDEPETMWLSQPGGFSATRANFNASNPIQDDDSINVTLASRQVNNIKYMIAMPGGLITLTGGGAWQVSGGSPNAAVTPTTITATPQAYNGCADLEPIPINYDILYVQNKGTVVRDLAYNFYTNIYTGTDISLLSNHLFADFTLTEWAYAEEPFKLVWAVRSDGQLISLTFLKEQEVMGWAHHHTLGTFESVATIQEGNVNAVYFVVRRYLQGMWTQVIERMQERDFVYGVEDAWFVDCGLTNELTFPAAGLSASSKTGTVTFTADAAVFSSGDVGSILRMNGGIATITAYTSPTVLVGTWTRDIDPDDLFIGVLSNGQPLPAEEGEWSLTEPFTTFSGLDHLEGETVTILGDGNVFPEQVVTDGSVTLDHEVSKIIVGLPYEARLQTLYLDVGEPTIQGKRKKIAALTTRVSDTRGLKMGSTFDTMKEFKDRRAQAMGQPIELFTGDQRIIMDPSWTVQGQICIQQSYPLPATVLGVIPEVVIGDTK